MCPSIEEDREKDNKRLDLKMKDIEGLYDIMGCIQKT